MTIRVPKTTINILPAVQPVSNQPQKILIVGQMTNGTATSGDLYQNILNDASWDSLFGRNSMISSMIRATKLINNVSRLDAIPLEDNGLGTFASGTISFTSPVKNGTVTVIAGSTKNNSYEVSVVASEAVGTICNAFVAAINADTTSQVTAEALTSLSSPVFTGGLHVVPPVFTGVGLDDLTETAIYIDTNPRTYIINIDSVGTPDTFEWSDDNGVTYTTGVPITGGVQTLSFGMKISFAATTGHTLGDSWTIDVVNDLNDLSVSGTYTGLAAATYLIEIDAENAPDTFKWSDDNGATYTSGVAITGVSQLLSNGVSVQFGVTAGHTLGNKWTIQASAGTLKLTAVNAGLEGNNISLAYSSSISDYAATIVAMAGGTNNPILTGLFDPISNIRYQTIVYPSTYDLTVLTDLLDARWNVNNKVLDGVGILSITDTYANLATKLNALNDQTIAIHCNKKIDSSTLKGSAIVEFDYVIAAEIGAINALRLTDGANISQYVISSRGLLDSVGGAAIASLPFFNTPFYNLPLTDQAASWTDEEIDNLKAAGGFVLGNNVSETNVIAGEVVTTYKFDSAGNQDISFKYIEYVETASNVREYFYNNVRERFVQSRLTTGDVVGNRSVVNAGVISAYFDELYSTLSGANYVLTQSGEAAMSYFKSNKIVTVDKATGKATVTMIVPIVTQLREVFAEMQIAFDFNQ